MLARPNKNHIFPFYDEKYDINSKMEENTPNDNRLIIGELYSLESESCDGFGTSEKVYELRGIVEEYKGYNINSVVVKQVSGVNTTIFELTRSMCKDLDIPYTERLQLLPLHLNWKHTTLANSETPTFDPNNLATFPSVRGFIKTILFKMDGFRSYRPTHIITPNGVMLNSRDFVKSFRVRYKEDVDGVKEDVKVGKVVKSEIFTSDVSDFERREYLCTENGEIFVRLILNGDFVTPQMLNGKSITDVFDITWDEKRAVDTSYTDALPSAMVKTRIENIGGVFEMPQWIIHKF